MVCSPGSADQIRSLNRPDSSVAIITVRPDRISSPTRLVGRSAVRPRRVAGSPSMLTRRSRPSSMSTNPPASAPVSSHRLAAMRSSTASRSRWAVMSATTSPSLRTTRARCATWFLAACSAPVRWQTFTQPMTSPAGSRSALMSMRRSSRVPSLRARRVAKEIWPPARMRSSTALCSAASSSGMIAGSVPRTSLAAQPNMRSAAGFQSSTVRSVPNATIASAALSTTARAVASTRSRPATARCCVTASSCHCLAGQSRQGTRSQGAGSARRSRSGATGPAMPARRRWHRWRSAGRCR